MKARHLISLAVFIMLGTGVLTPAASFAQRYPDRPIQIVIPNTAGSTLDVGARILAPELEKILDAKIIIVNKPGASGILGTEAVVRGKKDGYTLLYSGASAQVYAPNLNPEVVHYDPSKDLEPLGMHYAAPSGITVRADSPWKTFRELVDYAKKNPGKLRAATAGVGSTPHIALEVIQAMAGIKLICVPFQGGDTLVTAVLGGHVELTSTSFVQTKSHMEAGKVRLLLTTYKIPSYPEIPTSIELGYKENVPGFWAALYAPAGIPEEVRKILVPAVEKAVMNTKAKLEASGQGFLAYKSPSEQKKMFEEENKRIYELAVKLGLRKP